VTTPVAASTIAIVTSLLLQAPPAAASVNVIEEPVQTVEGPDTVPAVVNALTVNA
jgi:V8-like Glu-specific endopeptidase